MYNNGVGLYEVDGNRKVVLAKCRGWLEVVYEGTSHTDCIYWCHEHDMKMLPSRTWANKIINLPHSPHERPTIPPELQIGVMPDDYELP